MLGFLQGLIQHKDQRGQNRDAADHAEDNALCHDKAQIASQREGHEAQCREAGNRRDGAADDGSQRLMDGARHGFLVVCLFLALLVVAVPEEYGVVHRNGKLEHGGQRLGDVGNLTEEVVAAEVEQDHHADGGEEHEGNQPAVQQHHHGSHGAQHRQPDVDRLLLLAQILQIRDQRRHTRNKALLAGQGTNLPDGIHGDVRRGGAVEEHGDQRGIVGVELPVQLIRQYLLRNGKIRQRGVPQHRLDVLDALYLFAQRGNVPIRHILHHDEREGALAEILQQLVLSDDGVHAVRQVIQHIVIDAGSAHTQHCRNHQRQRYDQDWDAVPDNRL